MIGASDHRYPDGTVRALLDGEHVTAPTRAALRQRLADAPAVHSDVLGGRAVTLAAACDRLIPQPDRAAPIDVAATIHARLATGIGDGWRYADLPPDQEAWRRGLDGIDETARAMFAAAFASLPAGDRDTVLRAVQSGMPAGTIWRELPPARWFEELLAAAVEAYYAHPLAHEEIGYAGMADTPGWTMIGLGERQAREPAETAT